MFYAQYLISKHATIQNTSKCWFSTRYNPDGTCTQNLLWFAQRSSSYKDLQTSDTHLFKSFSLSSVCRFALVIIYDITIDII